LKTEKQVTVHTRTLVSLYRCASTEWSKSRTRDGLLWAAELKATRATRRTFKSLSCRASRKSPMFCLNNASMACGYNIQQTHMLHIYISLLRRSRSFKVADFGTNQKLIYNFLLVINTNLPPVLHRFQVMADYSSNFR